MIKKCLYFILIAFLFIECDRPVVKDGVEQALDKAGKNRGELEKALAYYSLRGEDSLKLKAMRFLIGNMPGHGCPKEGYEDLHQLTGEFLVNHVEKVFQQRDSCPWLWNMQFDTFLEYLLPYRAEDEMPEKRRDVSFRHHSKLMHARQFYDDCRQSVYQISDYMTKSSSTGNYLVSDSIYRLYRDSCEKLCNCAIQEMRNAGLPCAVDFIPVPFRNNEKPFWVTFVDDRLKQHDSYHTPAGRVGKVYRKTFSRHPIPEKNGEEFIPPFFLNPFYRDVTHLYLRTTTLAMDVPAEISNRYVYLAMFNDREWIPVDYSRVENGRCVFSNVGRNTVYLMVYYKGDNMCPIGAPFILWADDVRQPLVPGDSLISISVRRMQPYKEQDNWKNNYFLGSRFEGADDKSFKKNVVAYRIHSEPHYAWETIVPDSMVTRRYWRYSAFGSLAGNIAELEFIDANGEVIHGKIFGPGEKYGKVLFDGDMNTYTHIINWVGLDSGKPEKVSRFRYLPKTDGYLVYKGREYELMCYENGCWQIVGKEKTTDREDHMVVEFKSVPAGGLYRLKDAEKGEYSSVFTVEKQFIRYW